MASKTDTAIIWLDDPAAADCSLVGGKAANLHLVADRHPVPPAFVIGAPCLAGLSTIPLPDDGHAEPASLPVWLRDEIGRAYESLGDMLGGPNPSVAIRSSGVEEDGAETAFPGQFESYLNVVGVEAVCRAVAACWLSSRSDRVLAYRRNHGVTAAGGVAVLVQHLVAADSAAVAFSVNPITNNRNQLMINAGYGLGECIVAGMVNPDTYVVDKDQLTPLDIRIGDKKLMTVRLPSGTREVNVPLLLRSAQVLGERQIAEIARLAVDLEAAMGWPVDIECAYEKGNLYLLQCRPITTLRETKTASLSCSDLSPPVRSTVHE